MSPPFLRFLFFLVTPRRPFCVIQKLKFNQRYLGSHDTEGLNYIGKFTNWTIAWPKNSDTFLKKFFIASYNRQLSADINMKSYKIKTSFVSPEGPKTRPKKLVLIWWFYFNISEKVSVTRCYTWFSVWF